MQELLVPQQGNDSAVNRAILPTEDATIPEIERFSPDSSECDQGVIDRIYYSNIHDQMISSYTYMDANHFWENFSNQSKLVYT